MVSKLVVATHNTHKTDEIRQIVGSYFEEVVDLTSYPDIAPAEETGETFEENSAIKAFAASDLLPDACILADDSGLEVDALDGAPGVYSARFSGEGASDERNRHKLINDLKSAGAVGKARTARFRCVLTVVQHGKIVATFDGSCEGSIAEEDRGTGGFGYDPIFIPKGYDETFGQLSPEIKNRLSHRAHALELFSDWIQKT